MYIHSYLTFISFMNCYIFLSLKFEFNFYIDVKLSVIPDHLAAK